VSGPIAKGPLEERAASERFSKALAYASELHAHQFRKGSRIPYVAHLMSVAALVLEDGGAEDDAIAGLLHDAIEDQGHGRPDVLRAEIGARFGGDVLSIVEALTDSDTEPKRPWQERKQAYIDRLRTEPERILRVAAADKLHNARSILADHRLVGDVVWGKFKATPTETLWYYRQVEGIISQGLKTPLAEMLRAAVAELDHIVVARGEVLSTR
jgi:(p)ppGpp synthase/HD superfamily hydrolase